MAKHRTTFRKACDNIEAESRRQCKLIYSATALALFRHWNKGQLTILRLFEVSKTIWQECAATNQLSMPQICENETGIEVQCGDGKSWHDLPYLNATLNTARMSNAQWVYMKQQQLKWIAPGIVACLITALHRKYGFGPERCARIYQQIQDIEAEYSMNPKRLMQACVDETGINIVEVVT